MKQLIIIIIIEIIITKLELPLVVKKKKANKVYIIRANVNWARQPSSVTLVSGPLQSNTTNRLSYATREMYRGFFVRDLALG